MKSRLTLPLSALAAALALAGCGGGGGGSDPTPTPTPTNKFTISDELVITLPATAASSICYDLDTKPATSSANCTGNKWDLKVTGGLPGTLWTNSGSSGTGAGGAFGGPLTHTWEEVSKYLQGDADPVSGATLPSNVYTADSASSVFSDSNGAGSKAFEYAVTGGASDHNMYPNFRVFLITTDSAQAAFTGAGVYALQFTGYYSAAGVSGHPSLRWIKRDGTSTAQTGTFDASKGWVYVNLDTGATTTESGTWHIALNRLQVKLNGGSSNASGTVAGFLGLTPDGFYDASGKVIASQFTNPPLAALEAALTSTSISGPASARSWVKDSQGSALNPTYTGTYPNALNYGWFNYYPTAAAATAAGLPAVAHLLKANPENATLIRSGEGSGYARIRLKNITYADPNVATSQQTWTIGYDVQPSTN